MVRAGGALQGPSDRVKAIPTDGGQILRVASGELDVQRHLCKVSYRLWKIEGERLSRETEETHLMRFFFPLELNLFLELGICSGKIRSFPEFDRDPDETMERLGGGTGRLTFLEFIVAFACRLVHNARKPD